ncbi:TMEM165/GDT1 family protein [Schlegelella sp. S2-27]|uniref:GDT1 family protein n=1 Tax=Caldimonas mangrovi TaxID=2944811 RepID=A0ABT0YND9_9BURK|nr:TMEM165/GDT1 family protein [Caldimonas mangrovi]MCM5679681.1 TMEM165/GDT1 family protein [Caldimonas mangrovi]
MLEALLVSTGVVAASEIGDKTQLLALLLAARFRKPLPIAAGILVATLANHAGASALGALIQNLISETVLRYGLGLSFIAVAAWTLIPDKVDESATTLRGHWGVFGITTIAFFLAEMGDKTQIATVMLAAKYDAILTVTAGTTLGMMLANVPAVYLGDKAVSFVPLHWVRRVAAALFFTLGVLVLAGVGAL